jgi:hypothetical protein
MAGIFGGYSKASEGLYERVGGQNRKRNHFDCEATYILEVYELVSGKSKNPKQKNRPYFAAGFKIVEISSRGRNAEESQLEIGSIADFFTWLPKDTDVDEMDLEDQYNLADAITVLAAIVKMRKEGMDLELADQILQDNGEAVKGFRLGVDVAAQDGESRTFFKPYFYALDDDGERFDGYTEEELAEQ